ncbi:DNA repair protein, RAD5 [Mytilinidion resinicola]|uniref:DNA repair protein, RAD5 n=1 Tax=Mytilinidion resinicola TaxID=574789 RepID=A0A6A6YMB8_9PEZI|nr:DNA repair protein, RAD5 [Mytilinidion resinicola]KAF2809134.1 DNA repair protein, RAD5 [Mytilinidion resinicola]
MSSVEFQERPAKKRRFFVEDPSSPIVDRTLHHEPSLADALPDATPDADAIESIDLTQSDNEERTATENAGGFDGELFASVVGERVAPSVLRKLKEQCGDDIQKAINIYLDGSWNATPSPRPSKAQNRNNLSSWRKEDQKSGLSSPVADLQTTSASSKPSTSTTLTSTPPTRYIGAFGVTGWATKSGTGLIAYGQKVGIERAKMQALATKPGRGGKARAVVGKRQDIIVRFTNTRGEEVGRLENESAAWISTLIDQKICTFEGSCVYAPERLRTNENVYLQLRCYLLKGAFEAANFIRPQDNRETGLFEAKESNDEKNLRLRQVAMVKLFDEVNLHPTQINATTEKHKRQGLLQAAEIAEQHEKPSGNKTPEGKPDGAEGSSPPSDDAEEGQELEQDQLDTLYKKAQSFDFNTPTAEPAGTFCMDLRKYQKQALHWMISKEKDEKADDKVVSMHPLWEEYSWPTKDVDDKDLPEVTDQASFYVNPYSGELSLDFPVQEQNCLGGILADEMGLGKTIEMLSLIHTHRSDAAIAASSGVASVNNLPRLPKSSTSVERAPCTTLVVAPMSLLAQWQSEAEKASLPGTLKVMVYYGAEKSANLQKLCCEANAANAPNVIITSYGVILSEFNQVAANDGNRGSHGGLFSLEYFRVILDEAHFIKNRQSKTAKACYEISALHRWVLTGTPIVNRLEDLFSLVRFLRVEPWSNFSFWKTFITVPFESKDFLRALDVVQTVLEPLVLRRTKDMKTPDGKALVPLPPRTIEIERIELSKDEREVYDYIFTRAKRVFAANAEAGTLMKSYTTIFAQILRLRQSCCHPVLIRKKEIVADEDDAAAAADIANGLADDMDLDTLLERFASDSDQDANRFGATVLKQIQEEASQECPICSEDPMEDQAVTGCWHSACKQCLLDYITHQRDKGEIAKCFNCREPINARDVFEVIRHDEVPDDIDDGDMDLDDLSAPPPAIQTPRISLRRIGASGSAKTAALLTHLKSIRRTDAGMKSVVFSQFTSFLDLIEPALERDRIPFLRFDGSMAQKARAAVLTEFTTSKKGIVLLLSLRAGGVGLNLTSAKRVFMMDPWWSFAVEAQAIDRVHRMGQEGEVRVVRFVVEKSIEEKMLRIQERKKFIASSLGMMSDEEKRLQRIEDIKELLS